MEKSSYHYQIRQMRILAEAALTHYDIGRGRLSLLSHGDNTVFQITSLPGYSPATQENEEMRFVLRLSDPHKQNSTETQAELDWLIAIRRDTELIVPEPVCARNQQLIVPVQVEDIEPVRNSIIFHWIDGRFVDAGLTPALFERVGTFMAHLHQQAKKFVPPENFQRPKWDWHWIPSKSTLMDGTFVSEHGDGLIGKHERQLLEKTVKRIQAEMQHIPHDSANYGLIHSNLQQNHYLFFKNEVRAIDFKDCCWGYYLFDIAVALTGVAARPDEKKMQDIFIQSYLRINNLPDRYELYLRTFTAICILNRLNYLFGSKNPDIRADIPPYLDYARSWLGAYVDSKTRTYS